MKKFWRDPLFHFLLLGAGLFLAYGLSSKPGNSSDSGKIVVTQAQIQHLATAFTAAFQHPPNDEEMKGLIDDCVREEIAVREATALKLGENDAVIRRRLRQKFEYFSDGIANRTEPTDAELEAYLKAHHDRFSSEPTFTFTQIYLNPDKHGARLQREAAQLLAQLRRSKHPDLSELGDVSLLEQQFAGLSLGEVSDRFGPSFSKAMDNAVPGQWQGPIRSGYGLHIVKVTDRVDGRLPALVEVRESVKREWMEARRLEISGSLYADLLKRYTVRIEKPKQPVAGKEVASR